MQSRFRFASFLLASAVACAAQAGIVTSTSFVGYTGAASAVTPFVGSTPVTQSAANARDAFFASLNSVYFESFQDFSGTTGSSANNYDLTFDKFPNTPGTAPTGKITSSTPGNALLRKGTTSNNARGDFGALASPGTGSLSAANNWWLDILDPGLFEPSPNVLTLTFTPGQKAVGFLLNDVINPNSAKVTVNFLDGTTNVLTDVLGARNALGADASLPSNNVWFLGVIGTASISTVTIETLRAGDPIGLDNIYVSNDVVGLIGGPLPSVPTPAAFFGGAALLGSLVARRAARR